MLFAMTAAPDNEQAIRLANIGGEMNNLCGEAWDGEHGMGMGFSDEREPGLEYAIAQSYGISGMGEDPHPLTSVVTGTLNQISQPGGQQNLLQTLTQGVTQYLQTANAKKDAQKAARGGMRRGGAAQQVQGDGGGSIMPNWEPTTWLMVAGGLVAVVALIHFASKK